MAGFVEFTNTAPDGILAFHTDQPLHGQLLDRGDIANTAIRHVAGTGLSVDLQPGEFVWIPFHAETDSRDLRAGPTLAPGRYQLVVTIPIHWLAVGALRGRQLVTPPIPMDIARQAATSSGARSRGLATSKCAYGQSVRLDRVLRDRIVAAVRTQLPPRARLAQRRLLGLDLDVDTVLDGTRSSNSTAFEDLAPRTRRRAGTAECLDAVLREITRRLEGYGLSWLDLDRGPIEIDVRVDGDYVYGCLTDIGGRTVTLPPVYAGPGDNTQVRAATGAHSIGSELAGTWSHEDGADWLGGIAMRLILLCRGTYGSIEHDGLAESTLRLAVFADLAFAERLDVSEDGWRLDTTPTRFAPVDHLLMQVDAHPDRTMDWWIGRGPALAITLARTWVASGRWTVGRSRRPPFGWRFLDPTDPYALSVERTERALERVAECPREARRPHDAALAACASIGRLLGQGERPSPELLSVCGAASTVLRYGDLFVADARIRADLAEAQLRSLPSSTPGA